LAKAASTVGVARTSVSVEKGVSTDHVRAVVVEFERQLRSFLGFIAQR
jgi:hypothetical protein